MSFTLEWKREGVTEGENDDNGICQIEMKVNETDKEETGEMNH